MAGIEAVNASSAQSLLSSTKASAPLSSFNEARNESREESADKAEQNFSKKRVGEGSVKLDEERLAQAINEEKKRKFKGDGDDDNMGKKRKTVQQGSHDVTEEELGK